MTLLIVCAAALLTYAALVALDLLAIVQLAEGTNLHTSIGRILRRRLHLTLRRAHILATDSVPSKREDEVPPLEWWRHELEKRGGMMGVQAFLELSIVLVQKALGASGVAALQYVGVSYDADPLVFMSSPALGGRFQKSIRSLTDIFPRDELRSEFRDSAESLTYSGDLSVFGYRYSLLFSVPLDAQQRSALVFWCGFGAATRPDPSQRARALAIALALSARYRMLQDLMALTQRVREVEGENREKSEFLAHMSHDIRSPLSNIRSILSLLKIDSSTDEQRELLGSALKNCENLTEIVDDILDYSRHRAGKLTARRECFDVRELALELVESFKPSARFKGIALDAVGVAEAAFITADRRQIKRVLSNLISNGIKYTHYGAVSISLETTRDRMVVVTLSDTGSGMSAEQLSKLFTPFVRFEKGIEGVGLGLAVAKILVELNAGQIEAFSTVRKGSSFVLRFPQAESVAAEDARGVVVGHSVLLVDDDFDLLSSLGKVFELEGFRVVKASNVTEAMGLYNFAMPDIVVTDNNIPDGGGRRLVEHIRRSGREVRVCLLSGSRIPPDLNAMVDLVFEKPLDFAEFMARLSASADARETSVTTMKVA